MNPLSHLDVIEQRGVFVVHFLEQHLVKDLVSGVADELYALAESPGCARLLLDFSGVERMSSEMVGKVIMLNRKMRRKGGRLKLCGFSPYLRQILVETRLDTVLDLAATPDEALEAFDSMK